MLSYVAGTGINYCTKTGDDEIDKTKNKTIVKISSCLSLFEIALTLGSVLIAHKILANSLPSCLNFLKGRVGLASAMGITGLTLLTTFSMGAAAVRFCKAL